MSVQSLFQLAGLSLTVLALQGAGQPSNRLFDAVRMTAHIDAPRSVACHMGSAMLMFAKNGVELFAPPDNIHVVDRLGTKAAIWEIYGDHCIIQMEVKILTPHAEGMEATTLDNTK